MGKAYKVVVTGAFNSGKSEFVRTASDIPVVSTDRRISDDLSRIKEQTTVAMDYGQASVGNKLLHLFGTPGQTRFDFMWDLLSREANVLLVLIDSTNGSSLTIARRILRRLRRNKGMPFLVAATKQDGRRPLSPERIATSLHIAPSSVVTCDARHKASVRKVLSRLAESLD
jgi:signal recognition particle receptor subunit beta